MKMDLRAGPNIAEMRVYSCSLVVLFISPLFAAVFGDDAAETIDVRLREVFAVLLQVLPRIPLGADEFAGNTIAFGAGKINSQAGTKIQRHGAFFLPRFVLLKKRG